MGINGYRCSRAIHKEKMYFQSYYNYSYDLYGKFHILRYSQVTTKGKKKIWKINYLPVNGFWQIQANIITFLFWTVINSASNLCLLLPWLFVWKQRALERLLKLFTFRAQTSMRIDGFCLCFWKQLLCPLSSRMFHSLPVKCSHHFGVWKVFVSSVCMSFLK